MTLLYWREYLFYFFILVKFWILVRLIVTVILSELCYTIKKSLDFTTCW
ncbi:hypothetical protein [Spiroplasma poulsonii]|nr:hypothetical protein [Spiroplasma poulsonii]UNF61131.1 hypothetical protein MNU24_04215 [Spiroplasma poulsonii]